MKQFLLKTMFTAILAVMGMVNALAEEPTPVPEGVKIVDNVVVSWPQELIPNNGRIVLAEGITAIGEGAFAETGLKAIVFPKSLKEIRKEAFSGCTALQAIVIPEGVESLGESAFAQCYALIAASLPSTLKSIGDKAFNDCKVLKTLEMKEGITSIGYAAFYQCQALKEVELPTTVEKIGDGAFQNCTALTSISLPNAIARIDDNTFNGCTSLTEIELPAALKELGRYAFKDCSALTKVTLPTSITKIEASAFQACSALESITLPEMLTELEASAFEDCKALKSIKLPKKLTVVSIKLLKGCTALTELEIPEGVVEIKNMAVQNCIGLQKVTFPSTLVKIGLNAFVGSKQLATVVCNAAIPPQLTGDVFKNTAKERELYVPAGCVDAYKKAKNWSNFTTIKEIVKEEPKEEKQEPAKEGVAKFDFAKNPWKIEVSEKGDGPEVGKIDDGKEIVQDGIIFTNKKIHDRYWNRILGGNFKCYIHNTMTFTAPEKTIITKINFDNLSDQCDIKEISQTGGTFQLYGDEDSDSPYVWEGKAAVVTFKAELTSTFRSIEVTYQAEDANTGVREVKVEKMKNDKVYSLDGRFVGTINNLNALPHGIYIVNGKKLVK